MNRIEATVQNKHMLDIFLKMDRDYDGKISLAEFRSAITGEAWSGCMEEV